MPFLNTPDLISQLSLITARELHKTIPIRLPTNNIPDQVQANNLSEPFELLPHHFFPSPEVQIIHKNRPVRHRINFNPWTICLILTIRTQCPGQSLVMQFLFELAPRVAYLISIIPVHILVVPYNLVKVEFRRVFPEPAPVNIQP